MINFNNHYMNSPDPSIKGPPYRVCVARAIGVESSSTIPTQRNFIPAYALRDHIYCGHIYNKYVHDVFYSLDYPKLNAPVSRDMKDMVRKLEVGPDLKAFDFENFTLYVKKGLAYVINPRTRHLEILFAIMYAFRISNSGALQRSFNKIVINADIFVNRMPYGKFRYYITRYFLNDAADSRTEIEITRNILETYFKTSAFSKQYSSVKAQKEDLSSIPTLVCKPTKIAKSKPVKSKPEPVPQSPEVDSTTTWFGTAGNTINHSFESGLPNIGSSPEEERILQNPLTLEEVAEREPTSEEELLMPEPTHVASSPRAIDDQQRREALEVLRDFYGGEPPMEIDDSVLAVAQALRAMNSQHTITEAIDAQATTDNGLTINIVDDEEEPRTPFTLDLPSYAMPPPAPSGYESILQNESSDGTQTYRYYPTEQQPRPDVLSAERIGEILAEVQARRQQQAEEQQQERHNRVLEMMRQIRSDATSPPDFISSAFHVGADPVRSSDESIPGYGYTDDESRIINF